MTWYYLYWIIRQKHVKILTKSSTSNISQIQLRRGQSFISSYFVTDLYLTHFSLLFAWPYNSIQW